MSRYETLIPSMEEKRTNALEMAAKAHEKREKATSTAHNIIIIIMAKFLIFKSYLNDSFFEVKECSIK